MPDILYAAFNRNAESNNAFTAALVPSTQALKIKTHNHMLLATYEVFINTKLRYIQRFYIPYSVLCHMTITRIQRSKDLWIACESRHCYIACLCLCFCCCFFRLYSSMCTRSRVLEAITLFMKLLMNVTCMWCMVVPKEECKKERKSQALSNKSEDPTTLIGKA